jgi:hypothetical protein
MKRYEDIEIENRNRFIRELLFEEKEKNRFFFFFKREKSEGKSSKKIHNKKI